MEKQEKQILEKEISQLENQISEAQSRSARYISEEDMDIIEQATERIEKLQGVVELYTELETVKDELQPYEQMEYLGVDASDDNFKSLSNKAKELEEKINEFKREEQEAENKKQAEIQKQKKAEERAEAKEQMAALKASKERLELAKSNIEKEIEEFEEKNGARVDSLSKQKSQLQEEIKRLESRGLDESNSEYREYVQDLKKIENELNILGHADKLNDAKTRLANVTNKIILTDKAIEHLEQQYGFENEEKARKEAEAKAKAEAEEKARKEAEAKAKAEAEEKARKEAEAEAEAEATRKAAELLAGGDPKKIKFWERLMTGGEQEHKVPGKTQDGKAQKSASKEIGTRVAEIMKKQSNGTSKTVMTKDIMTLKKVLIDESQMTNEEGTVVLKMLNTVSNGSGETKIEEKDEEIKIDLKTVSKIFKTDDIKALIRETIQANKGTSALKLWAEGIMLRRNLNPLIINAIYNSKYMNADEKKNFISDYMVSVYEKKNLTYEINHSRIGSKLTGRLDRMMNRAGKALYGVKGAVIEGIKENRLKQILFGKKEEPRRLESGENERTTNPKEEKFRPEIRKGAPTQEEQARQAKERTEAQGTGDPELDAIFAKRRSNVERHQGPSH